MNKRKIKILIVFLCILCLFITFYFIKKKTYETKLEEVFYTYAIQQGIPKEKIRNTDLNYYSKGNRYEYNVYIKNTDDDKYFNFFYLLNENPFKAYLFQGKVDNNSIGSSAYIDGSVVGLDDKMAEPLLDKIQ